MSVKTVLISGAGIGGPALAFWLNAAGFETTLIERAPALRSGGYVVDFWGLGYEIAERMGLRADIQRAGYRIREVRIVGDDGRRIASFGTSVFHQLTDGHFVTLGRSDLSRIMFERIQGRTETVFGDEVTALREEADGVRVEFAHATARRFDLVIGADGLHSGIRRLAFGPQQQFEKQLGYAVATFEIPGYRPRDEDVYVIYGKPGRMLGRFTLHGDRTLFLFVFTAGPGTLPLHDAAGQKAMLRQRYGEDAWECPDILAALDHVDELYFDRVSQIRMETWARGRIALTGDAAFCISLTGGQGSALAMTAAYVLAGELARADGDYQAAFGQYQAVLRDYIVKKQQGAERFASAFAPRTASGLFLRNQVLKLARIPAVARFLIGRDIVDKLQLPAYDWPIPSPPFALEQNQPV